MQRPSIRTIVALFLGFLFLGSLAESFIGNIRLPGAGSVPCLVACGGSRGVVNTRFFGDTVSQFVTGPSIDKFEEAGNRVVDRANEKLNATLEKKMQDFSALLTKQREEAIAGLAGEREKFQLALRATSEEALANLDKTLGENLKEGDIILERRLGNLQAISQYFIVGLGATLRESVLFLCLAVFGCVAIWAYRAGRPKRILQAALITVGVLVLALLGARVARERQLAHIEEDFRNHYRESLSDLNFRYAAFWASQLQTLHPSSAEYRAYSEKASLLREIFSRPTSTKSPQGFREFQARARATQSLFKKANLPLDPDTQVVAAVVLWQAAEDRFNEYVAANLAAHAIELERATPKGGRWFWNRESPEPAVLLSLAHHYLKMYLTFPLTDKELVSIGFNREESNEALEDESFRYRSLKELQDLLGSLPAEAGESPLGSYLTFGDLTASAHRTIVPAYLQMLISHVEAETLAEPERGAAVQRRNAASESIVAAWETYVSALEADHLRDSQLPLKALSSITATYSRAKMYRNTDPAAGVPARAAEKDGIHTRLLASVRPSLSDLGYAALTAAAALDAEDQQTQLINFENQMRDFFSKLRSYEESSSTQDALLQNSNRGALQIAVQALAYSGATLGVFACFGQQDSLEVRCKEGEMPRSIVSFLHELTPRKARLEEGGAADIENLRAAVATRSLPVL